MGHHTPAAAYRGSVTGSNGHAKWTGCSVCLLRLEYTPAYGATGLHRQAGPLPEDTKKQVEELGEKAPGNPLLKNQAIGLDGAERYAPGTPSTNETEYTPTSAAQPSPTDAEELSQVPGRKTRKGEQAAEDLEYQEAQQQEGSWSPVRTSPSTLARSQ